MSTIHKFIENKRENVECAGQTHLYFPDFIVEGQLIELKGDQFLTEDGKWQNPYDASLNDLYEAKHQCALANNVQIMYSAEYKNISITLTKSAERLFEAV